MYHPVFWNTHTCLYFPTHVWFLPNTLTCLMYLVKSTRVVKTTHMIVQVIIGNSHTCLVFTIHMEVVEISVNFHTCVVFTKQPEWDPSLNNFHSKLLSYFEQFPFLSILISFIFEFFGSLGTKTLLLRKFSFWYGNTILFYILSLDVRFQENSKNDNFEVQQGNGTMVERDKLERNDTGEAPRRGKFFFWWSENK